ncbi:hypothetical protein DNU06_07365 [Putridiphycobacter roseus]|uniref:N-acetyltransferase domain-containing protein n=1 Tax=Putridiphycobacter roseus TaxID=2219161 RepID=A0A2W1N252_9FLAO|nr:GNAT family N-acetyltransferase [Putridiphycobacter roseus]PZE17640.1 hypothetical protein DNU06_07365 [Putridiphycobacter roseus]
MNQIPPVTIHFRGVERRDETLVFGWENDREMWVYSGLTKPYTKAEIGAFVSNPPKLLKDEQERFMVVLAEGTVVGCIDFFEYIKVKHQVSVGILIDKNHRNSGYAKLALLEIEKIAKKKFKINCLKAKILANNLNSIRVFKNAGYQLSNSPVEAYQYQLKEYQLLTYIKTI